MCIQNLDIYVIVAGVSLPRTILWGESKPPNLGLTACSHSHSLVFLAPPIRSSFFGGVSEKWHSFPWQNFKFAKTFPGFRFGMKRFSTGVSSQTTFNQIRANFRSIPFHLSFLAHWERHSYFRKWNITGNSFLIPPLWRHQGSTRYWSNRCAGGLLG